MVSSGGRLTAYRTGGGGFVIPPVAASLLLRFTAFGRLSFNPGQAEFSVAKLST